MTVAQLLLITVIILQITCVHSDTSNDIDVGIGYEGIYTSMTHTVATAKGDTTASIELSINPMCETIDALSNDRSNGSSSDADGVSTLVAAFQNHIQSVAGKP